MDIEKIVQSLIEAEKNRQAIPALTDRYSDLSVSQAYQIQLGYVAERVQAGAKIVGKKVGLTSQAMQELLGVKQPDYGHILSDMVFDGGQAISVGRFIQPKIEFEIAFVLKEDLLGPGLTEADVLAATDYVLPAFEIIDSRIEDWKIKFEDTVADNGSSAGVILGQAKGSLAELALDQVTIDVYHNEQLVDQAKGEAVMGNPIHAVVWLANELGKSGTSLKAGETILSGALSKALEVKAGDRFRIDYSAFGEMTVEFTA